LAASACEGHGFRKRDLESRQPGRTGARDVYSYAHLPMIVGISLFAFAMWAIIGHAGEELDPAAAFALCGGCALSLLTFSAIRIRIQRRLTVSRGRFVAALALLLVIPLATAVPALAALAVVTAVWLALHAAALADRCVTRRGARPCPGCGWRRAPATRPVPGRGRTCPGSGR
jgi:low temperature requirement protein LtrA